MESANLSDFWGHQFKTKQSKRTDDEEQDTIWRELDCEREITQAGVHAVQREIDLFSAKLESIMISFARQPLSKSAQISVQERRCFYFWPPFSGDLLRLKRTSRSRVLSSWSKRRFCLNFVSRELWYFKRGLWRSPKGKYARNF